MPASNFTMFNSFLEALGRKVHNLNSGDVIKIMLVNSVPALSAAVKADLTEISPGFGYSAGGISIGTHDYTQASGIAKFTIAADPVITASGGNIGPFLCPVL